MSASRCEVCGNLPPEGVTVCPVDGAELPEGAAEPAMGEVGAIYDAYEKPEPAKPFDEGEWA